MIKKLTIYLLILITLSSFILCTTAANAENVFGIFTGNIVVEVADDTTLENIKINIYSSTLDQQDDMLGMKGFSHEYYDTVYTDTTGSFSFVKPSYEFLLVIDIDSLPDGYGIEKDTYFYKYGESQDTYDLNSISDIVVQYNPLYDNSIEVSIFDTNGISIIAPYTINVSDDRLSLTSLSSEIYTLSGDVICNNTSVSFAYEIPYNSISYIDEAVSQSLITETDAINLVSEKMEFTSSAIDVVVEKNLLNKYNESVVNSQIMQEATVTSSYIPTYTSKKVYPSSTATPFRIYYEGNGLTDTPTFITDVYSHLLTTYDNLITNKQFLEPSSSLSSDYIDVYITSNTYSSGVPAITVSLSNNTSFIVIYGISDLSQQLQLTTKGTISHEYFHCIQNKYRNIGDIPDWVNEAFANWAKITVASKDSLSASIVNRYLSSTYLSLDNIGSEKNNRYYGEVLFPLYLDQYLGGYSTIRKVYEYFNENTPIANTNLYVMNAITNALSSQNYTFSSFFTEFAVANYTPQTSYNASLSGWNTEPFISNEYETNEYPNNAGQYTINYLAMHYQNFILPTSGSYTVDYTVNFTSGEIQNAKCKLLLTGGNTGNIIQRSMTQSSNLYTYSLSSTGSTYSKACIMPVNVGSANTLLYRLTASLQQ